MKKGSKKSSKKSLLLVVLLLLVGVTGYFAVNSYAKYATHIEGNQGTVQVAKWAFATDNQANDNLEIDLTGTYDPTTLVADRIAPGTEGAFSINLNNKNSEVGVDFTVKINEITNAPKNLKFYREAAHTNEIVPGTTTITGQLTAGDATGKDVEIYWVWAYETDAIATNDPLDTADGEAARELTIGLDIVGVQTQPGAAITSHVNPAN